jgi:hypothetical protein
MSEDVRLGVDDAGRLVLDRRHHVRVAVTGVDDRDAGCKVGVALAVDVPDVDPSAVVDMERRVPPNDARHDLHRIENLLPALDDLGHHTISFSLGSAALLVKRTR